MKTDYIRAITPILYRHRGSKRALLNALHNMDDEALRELHALLRDMEDEINREKRTFRPFPGGPKVRF